MFFHFKVSVKFLVVSVLFYAVILKQRLFASTVKRITFRIHINC